MDAYLEAYQKAKEHARREYPRESCGVIVEEDGTFVYVPSENLAKPPESHVEDDPDCACQLCSFVLDPKLQIAHEGRIRMILHSHPDGPIHPSKADAEAQIKSGLAWGVIPLDEDRTGNPIVWGGDTPMAPLVGRPFMHYISDCYTLIRDTFELGREKLVEQGVTEWPYDPLILPHWPRNDCWWVDGEDHYLDNYREWGFEEIRPSEVRPGDVFLIKIKSDKLNHGGMLIGNNLILHHLPDRLSRREPASIWGRNADMWIRYTGNTP